MIFSLSEYLENKNNCLYCCVGNCTKHNNEKAKNLPTIIKNIIRNPNKILEGELKKTLEENKMNIGEKHLHINTCVWNYIYPECKNCSEKRYKKITHNGIELKICWPLLKKGTNVIPIGLHWDLSLKIENSQIVKEYTKIKIYDGLFEKNKFNNQKKLEVDITKINHYVEDENNSEENTIIITDSKIDDINDNEIEVINDEFQN